MYAAMALCLGQMMSLSTSLVIRAGVSVAVRQTKHKTPRKKCVATLECRLGKFNLNDPSLVVIVRGQKAKHGVITRKSSPDALHATTLVINNRPPTTSTV